MVRKQLPNKYSHVHWIPPVHCNIVLKVELRKTIPPQIKLFTKPKTQRNTESISLVLFNASTYIFSSDCSRTLYAPRLIDRWMSKQRLTIASSMSSHTIPNSELESYVKNEKHKKTNQKQCGLLQWYCAASTCKKQQVSLFHFLAH